MLSQEDRARARMLGAKDEDVRAAGVNITGPSAHAPEAYVLGAIQSQKMLREHGESMRRITAMGPVPNVPSAMPAVLKVVGYPLLLISCIYAAGMLSAPDHSHVDVNAIRQAKPDPGDYAPTDPRVQALAGLPITTIVRDHVSSSRIPSGTAATEEQLLAGHALWLRFMEVDREAYRRLDISMREAVDRLVGAYLFSRYDETGSVQSLIDFANARQSMNPYHPPSDAVYQKLALEYPDEPALEAMATRANGNASIYFEHRFFRGLYFMLSFVGLDDNLAAFVRKL